MPNVLKMDPRQTILLLDLHIFLVAASGGVMGCAVKHVRDYYGIENALFNALYYGPTGIFILTMPMWYTLQEVHSWGYLFTVTTFVSAAGFIVQVGYYQSFWIALVGVLITTTSQSFMWTTSSQLINRWIPAKQKSWVYGSFFASGGAGSILSFLLGRYVISSGHAFHERYVYIVSAYAAMCLVLFILSFTLPHIPVPDDQPTHNGWVNPDKTRYNYDHVLTFAIVYVLVAGPIWTISSLLVEKLTDHGYSETEITIAWLLYAGVGFLTPYVVGVILGDYRQYRITVFLFMIAILVIYIPWVITFSSLYACLVLTAVLGFATGAPTTMFVETMVELAFPTDGREWSVLMIFWANVNSILCTLLASFDETLVAAQWVFGGLFVVAIIWLAIDLSRPALYHRMVEEDTDL